MYAAKRLTVIGRTPAHPEDVERITDENQTRRRANEHEMFWQQMAAENARKAERESNKRSRQFIACCMAYMVTGAAVALAGVSAAFCDMEALNMSCAIAFGSLMLAIWLSSKVEPR